jgi:hypothetical protein
MTVKTNRITKPKDFRNHAPMHIRQAVNLIAGVMRRIQVREERRKEIGQALARACNEGA